MAETKKEEKGSVTKANLLEKFNQILNARLSGQDPIALGIIPGNPVTKKVLAADKQADRLIKRADAAKDDWLDGYKNPSRNPIEASIAAQDKWVNKITNKDIQDKRVKNLKKTSLSEMQGIAEKVGAEGFAKGLADRKDKILRVRKELQPLQQSVSDTIQAMSDATDSDREKRLTSARKLMIEVGKKR